MDENSQVGKINFEQGVEKSKLPLIEIYSISRNKMIKQSLDRKVKGILYQNKGLHLGEVNGVTNAK